MINKKLIISLLLLGLGCSTLSLANTSKIRYFQKTINTEIVDCYKMPPDKKIDICWKDNWFFFDYIPGQESIFWAAKKKGHIKLQSKKTSDGYYRIWARRYFVKTKEVGYYYYEFDPNEYRYRVVQFMHTNLSGSKVFDRSERVSNWIYEPPNTFMSKFKETLILDYKYLADPDE